MRTLATILLSVSIVTEAQLLQQRAGSDVGVVAGFDDLQIKSPSHAYPLDIYKGLKFTDIDYESSRGQNFGLGNGAHSSHGNNVAVYWSSGSAGLPSPSITTLYSGSKSGIFNLQSLRWGCDLSTAPRNSRCNLDVTGYRGGQKVAFQEFSSDRNHRRALSSLARVTLKVAFTNVDTVRFHTRSVLSSGKITSFNAATWLDDIQYILHQSGTPTTSTIVSSITSIPPTISTDLPSTISTEILPSTTCFELCVDNIDECGQFFGGCFNPCATPFPTFTPPNRCLTSTLTFTSSSTISITFIPSSTIGTETTSSFPSISSTISTVVDPEPTPTSDPIDHTLPFTPDGRCGSEFGTRCPDDSCCSQYGWCGPSPYGQWCERCQIGYGFCDR